MAPADLPNARAMTGLGRYQRTRRLVIGAMIAVLFALLLFVQSLWPPETALHEAIEMIGVVLIVLGIVGRLWANLYIAGRKSEMVVTGGPYSMTRNPLYLFSAVAAAGVGAQIGSITTMVLFAVLCAGTFQIVIRREERFLAEEFGEPYREYMRRVPRFFPDIRLYREGETGAIQSKGLLSTLLDGLLFFIAMPVFEMIDAAQIAGNLPVLLRLP
ncbi:MAG: isoprenylcysteine carboxylmethyltransferase family protein [Rhizobiaceae bacterium]|nr:isoprenylcysteine carboxylmethyltransferase family protein [Rhizobiaceae bacterium]